MYEILMNKINIYDVFMTVVTVAQPLTLNA